MLSAVSHNDASENVEVRFIVVGWGADECSENEGLISELKAYVSGAALAGLDAIDISEDLADGRHFGHVDVGMVRSASKTVVTVVAQAGDRPISQGGRVSAPMPSRGVA